ncbi:EpsG family protein [Anaerococcus tetradius]|uniref:EpsG family protein n=1 Tax=Anaerococcus tetradius TaxID=33036 RepID=UPI0023F561DB|nr:EpsG family protein [Anaerococcus tetradius]
MTIYIILLLVVLFNIFLEANFNKLKIFNIKINSRKLSFFSCFIFILLLGVLRHELLGVDVKVYKNYFMGLYADYNIKYFIGNLKYDIGYITLNKLIFLLSNNFRIFEIVVFCTTFGIFSLIIYKESKYPALSFLIYIALDFIGFNMCILRQAVACTLCFLAYYFLEKNKKIQYILLVILAITFHKTAILFFLTYFLSLNKENISSYAKNLIYIFIFYLGFNLILPKLIGIYTNDYSDTIIAGQGFNLLLFYLIAVMIMRLIYNKECSNIDMMRYESSFGTVYMQIGALSFALFTRITKYFAIIFTLSIPNIVYKSKYRSLYIVIYCIMFSILYIYGLYSNGTEIVPYRSVFSFI